ncbi:MAG TPA: LysR substrate-binding domain-containing protein [Planctomycetota bacterium]|nr:LysR substrate-binding domain-containing protein [Planctomycetota bacterium]
MTPAHLRTFLAVQRHLSFTRAASELHLSQSATWRQVRALEGELGVRLIEPLGKALHLTDAGRTLAAEAEVLLGHIGHVEEAVRSHGSGVRGRLRIGASTTPGYYLLPAALGRFHRAFPDVELAYEIENSAGIEQRLLRNELDLGFVGGELLSEELESEQLSTDRIVCYAARDNPLAKLRRIGPRELAGATCVLRESGSATRRMFEAWLTASGNRLGQTIVVRCPEVAKALVTSGVGYSVISSHALATPELSAKCVRLRVKGLDLERPVTVGWHRRKRITRAMQAFLDLCRTSPA